MYPIIRGHLFKLSTLLKMHKKRFFQLNPNDGLLIRYKKESDFPLNPKYIIIINQRNNTCNLNDKFCKSIK